ncbi:MAG: recombinase family protein, partial [Streptosporangiaceae bacterium]
MAAPAGHRAGGRPGRGRGHAAVRGGQQGVRDPVLRRGFRLHRVPRRAAGRDRARGLHDDPPGGAGRLGYCRVSTRGQTLEVQLAALSTAGVADSRVFAEKKSGRSGSKRPQWEDVRSRLRPGDTLVVSKLDRMGRDMREIME